jgi:hypothetical protein
VCHVRDGGNFRHGTVHAVFDAPIAGLRAGTTHQYRVLVNDAFGNHRIGKAVTITP